MITPAKALQQRSLNERPPLRKNYDLQWDEPTWLTQDTRRMKRETEQFLTEIQLRHRPRRWLTLCGQSGCGKTHLARQVRRLVGDWGIRAQFWSVPTIARMLRGGNYDLIDQLQRMPILILDDLGTEQQSGFLTSSLYEILNSRLEKWTMITSNLSPGEIGDKIDIRITSRLYRGGNIVVTATTAHDYCYKLKTNLS